jgi:rsbT co-antagonist protein RsbR
VSEDCAKGELSELVASINGVLTKFERNNERMHNSTMELAIGLSDCFEALSQVRKGNLDARVSDATLHSDDELLSKFAKDLNLTLDDVRETIDKQRFAIQTLSTPVLQLWKDVIAVPVIGVVDTQRSTELMEKLLSTVVERHARYVILDITGVDIVDTKTADHFVKVIGAAQLLGAQCILTGIQPAVAQTLVEIGVDLSSMTTLRSLEDGLRECLKRMDNSKSEQKSGQKPGQRQQKS